MQNGIKINEIKVTVIYKKKVRNAAKTLKNAKVAALVRIPGKMLKYKCGLLIIVVVIPVFNVIVKPSPLPGMGRI